MTDMNCKDQFATKNYSTIWKIICRMLPPMHSELPENFDTTIESQIDQREIRINDCIHVGRNMIRARQLICE